MSFNPDPTKQAKRSYSVAKYPRKVIQTLFLIIAINLTIIHKHLGMIFEVKLWLTLKVSVKKVSKTIGLLPNF